MEERFSRTALMIGEEALGKLRSSRVAIFGVGGVGGYVCEALARGGVYKLSLFDIKSNIALRGLRIRRICENSKDTV